MAYLSQSMHLPNLDLVGEVHKQVGNIQEINAVSQQLTSEAEHLQSVVNKFNV